MPDPWKSPKPSPSSEAPCCRFPPNFLGNSLVQSSHVKESHTKVVARTHIVGLDYQGLLVLEYLNRNCYERKRRDWALLGSSMAADG